LVRSRRPGRRSGSPGVEVQGSLPVMPSRSHGQSPRDLRAGPSRRRLVRLAVAGLALTLLVLPAAAAAAVQLRGVDASAYPTIRASVVSPSGASVAPTITENGLPVAGLLEQNLGQAKAIATLIDRSQSMRGKPLAAAISAARAFVAAKQPADELAVIAFGSRAATLSPFSTVKLDADSALAHL